MRALREEQRRLGARLRALREERALTQEQAAEQIGLHSNHLQRLERGAANVTLVTLVAVSLAYRVSVRSLFEQPRSKRIQPFRRVASEQLADHVVITRSQHIPRIQEAQASAYHVLRELVETRPTTDRRT